MAQHFALLSFFRLVVVGYQVAIQDLFFFVDTVGEDPFKRRGLRHGERQCEGGVHDCLEFDVDGFADATANTVELPGTQWRGVVVAGEFIDGKDFAVASYRINVQTALGCGAAIG